LNPKLIQTPLNENEIKCLFMLYQKHGTSWAKMASIFEIRSENILKNTFHKEVKRICNILPEILEERACKSIYDLELTFDIGTLKKISKKLNVQINEIPFRPVDDLFQAVKSVPRETQNNEKKCEPITQILIKYYNLRSSIKGNKNAIQDTVKSFPGNLIIQLTPIKESSFDNQACLLKSDKGNMDNPINEDNSLYGKKREEVQDFQISHLENKENPIMSKPLNPAILSSSSSAFQDDS